MSVLPKEISRIISDFLPTPRDDLKMVAEISSLAFRIHRFCDWSCDECFECEIEFGDYMYDHFQDISRVLPKLQVLTDKFLNNPFDIDEEEEYYDHKERTLRDLVFFIVYHVWI